MELIERWEGLYGVRYQGAWNKRPIGDGNVAFFTAPMKFLT